MELKECVKILGAGKAKTPTVTTLDLIMNSKQPIQVLPVVMAGGSGTRLWPLSRAQHPKQFLVLQGNQSLFQQAAQRLATLAESAGVTPVAKK